MSRFNQNNTEDKECVIAGASLSPTDRMKHLTEAFPPKLVLTPRRPRYSYYKQVLVSPYMQLMLSPRGGPLEKRGYEDHVLSQKHSGDAGNRLSKVAIRIGLVTHTSVTPQGATMVSLFTKNNRFENI